MLRPHRQLPILVSVLAVAVASCNQEVRTATQIQMDSMDEMKATYGSHLDQMADNANLHEMALVDFHFVAHTSELSGTGAERLDRMAPYLETYGGVVRYQTYIDEEALVARRMDHVREYLALVGCDMSRVEVKHMMSGGRRISAEEAIEIDERGTANEDPEADASEALMTAASMTGSQP